MRSCSARAHPDAFAPQSSVIVNTISELMDLSHGAISKAILQEAGSKLQGAILNTAGPNPLAPGSVVVTDGFNLQCQKVFHTVCPKWSTSGQAEKVSFCDPAPAPPRSSAHLT